jgi:D-serine dehydratase
MTIIYAMAEWAMGISCNVQDHSEIRTNHDRLVTYLRKGVRETTNYAEEITGISVSNLEEVKNVNSKLEIRWFGKIKTKEGEKLITSENLNVEARADPGDYEIMQKVIDKAIESKTMKIISEKITKDELDENTYRIRVKVEFRWKEEIPCGTN